MFPRKKPVPDNPLDGTGEEMVIPSYVSFDDAAARTSLWRMLARLPSTVVSMLATARATAPTTVVVLLAIEITSGVASGLGLYSTASVLRQLLTTGPTPQRLIAALPALALVVTFLSVQQLGGTLSAYLSQTLSARIQYRAAQQLIAVASHVDLAAYDDPNWFDGLDRAYDSSMAHIAGAFSRMVTALGSLISLLATAVTVTALDPFLLPALVLSTLPASLAALQASRLLYDSVRRTSTLRRRRWLITRMIRNEEPAAEIRAYRAQPFLLQELQRIGGLLEQEEVRLAGVQARTTLLGRVAGGIGLGLAYGLLGLFLYTGRIPLAVGGAALIAIQVGRARLTDMLLAVSRLYEQSLYVADYDTFLTDAKGRTHPGGGRPAPTTPERYRVEDVSFAYPGAERQALSHVTLEFRRGQIIALVGENGSGKSTLAKLLAGLYHPDSGRIRWDEVDLAEADPNTVRDGVAVVMQDPIHWPTTLRANVRIGRIDRPDPDDVALRHAALASGADVVADQLPHGWDTMLSRQFVNGVRLSGGQEQRVAIARGLYRDADLIIADEPTANLDARAEAQVYESLATLAAGRTTILITHRLASVHMADYVYVLHDGELVEEGTPLSLIAEGGRFAELYQLQSRNYQTGPVPAPAEDGG
ncbi:ABC transporter ATP-binding protein [Solihabitans fulvus]|uniref:ABC transporter ATP-binding protein n=1 Tax=Solihabitans fulvus TaxID=1892852 RepID=A0A5B2WYG7_9PSEU|nr:ABC transporter ATP-binding protein [Solihabitans fulvus]KAA2255964.1 ABC transporter ATP-binding protein [Solihabitans fulvus]